MRAGLTARPTLLSIRTPGRPTDPLSLAAYAPAPPARRCWPTRSPKGGADWQTVQVRDLASGQGSRRRGEVDALLGPVVDEGREGVLLLALSRSRRRARCCEAALSGQALYYHRVGTPQSQDAWSTSARTCRHGSSAATVTEDGRYLLVSLAEGSDNNNRLYYADLGDPLHPRRRRPRSSRSSSRTMRSTRRSATRDRCCSCGPTATRPNRKVIGIDLRNPAPSALEDDRSRSASRRSRASRIIGGRIVAEYLVDVQSRLRLFDARRRAAGRAGAARHRCRWPGSADARTRRRSSTRSPRRCIRRPSSPTTRRRGRARRSSRRSRPIDVERSTRRRRSSPRRRTARGCRSS